MRALLLLALLSSGVALGQIATCRELKEAQRKAGTYQLVSCNDCDDQAPTYKHPARQLNDLFDEYKAECWADSSCHDEIGHIYKNKPFVNHSPVSICNERCYTYYRCDCPYVAKWEHRKPDFEGFMYFIEKRSK